MSIEIRGLYMCICAGILKFRLIINAHAQSIAKSLQVTECAVLKLFFGNNEPKSRILASWLIGIAVSLLKKTA